MKTSRCRRCFLHHRKSRLTQARRPSKDAYGYQAATVVPAIAFQGVGGLVLSKNGTFYTVSNIYQHSTIYSISPAGSAAAVGSAFGSQLPTILSDGTILFYGNGEFGAIGNGPVLVGASARGIQSPAPFVNFVAPDGVGFAYNASGQSLQRFVY